MIPLIYFARFECPTPKKIVTMGIVDVDGDFLAFAQHRLELLDRRRWGSVLPRLRRARAILRGSS